MMNNNPETYQPRHQTPETQARPARVREVPNWRRFDVASEINADTIIAGIDHALESKKQIDEDTALRIAGVLGRAIGPDSHLSTYARTNTGNYEEIREEYLSLYHHPEAPPRATDLINWLGYYAVRQRFRFAESIQDPEPYPPKLENILVPTEVEIRDQPGTVHVPGIYGNEDIEDLKRTLRTLRYDQDAALQAFLSLPNVNAMSGDIMGDFHDSYIGSWHNHEDAISEICDLDDKEREVLEFASERGFYFDYLTPDYDFLEDEAREAYDIVRLDDETYVFAK